MGQFGSAPAEVQYNELQSRLIEHDMLHDEMTKEQLEYQMTRNTFTGDQNDVQTQIVIDHATLSLKENHMDASFWDDENPTSSRFNNSLIH